jgi:hypothetical protein
LPVRLQQGLLDGVLAQVEARAAVTAEQSGEGLAREFAPSALAVGFG